MKNDFYIQDEITIIYAYCKGSIVECLIDTSMLNKANEFPNTWQAKLNPKSDTYYMLGALKAEPKKGYKYAQSVVMLHRWLIDAPESKLVDHRNHNPLDNRLENLRLVDYSQNGHNRRGRADTSTTSGVRNVTWDAHKEQWRAAVTLHGKYNHLGYYDTISEAELNVQTFRKENLI